MTIAITVPSNTHSTNDTGHTTDHNTIVGALTTLGSSAAATAGDTFTGLLTASNGLTVSGAALNVAGISDPSAPSSATADLYADATTGVLKGRLSSGFIGYIPLVQTSVSGNTVTAASETLISINFSIPAHDAAVGTCYRLTTGGQGTQGSSAQTLAFRGNYTTGGGLNSVTLASGFAGASTAFRWWAELLVTVTAIGASGSIVSLLRGMTMSTAAGNLVTPFASSSSGSTVDTTSAWGVEIDCAWGSTTGAPTITSNSSLFERLGQ